MNQDSQDELDRIIRNYRDAWHRALRKADLAERESTIRHAEKDADRAEKYLLVEGVRVVIHVSVEALVKYLV